MEVRDQWMDKLQGMGVDLNPKKLLQWAEDNPDVVALINRDMLNAMDNIEERSKEDGSGTTQIGGVSDIGESRERSGVQEDTN